MIGLLLELGTRLQNDRSFSPSLHHGKWHPYAAGLQLESTFNLYSMWLDVLKSISFHSPDPCGFESQSTQAEQTRQAAALLRAIAPQPLVPVELPQAALDLLASLDDIKVTVGHHIDAQSGEIAISQIERIVVIREFTRLPHTQRTILEYIVNSTGHFLNL
jgi:hypothetical protein